MTVSHEIRVSEIAADVATILDLKSQHVGAIRLAALMHDVGKVVVPEKIISKPGPLTDLEYAIVKSHAIVGARLVQALDLPVHADWIKHHHERFDGHGYPDGLAGEAIPVESRIIFVADVFDALTANRPYRTTLSPEDALEEIEHHAGTQFDPHCVVALVKARHAAAQQSTT